MNDKREHYTVDFSRVRRWQDVHKIIKQDLDFPAYYGENLDALWDCLGELYYSDIEITGVHAVPQNEDCQYMIKEVLRVLHDAQKKFSHLEIHFID